MIKLKLKKMGMDFKPSRPRPLPQNVPENINVPTFIFSGGVLGKGTRRGRFKIHIQKN